VNINLINTFTHFAPIIFSVLRIYLINSNAPSTPHSTLQFNLLTVSCILITVYHTQRRIQFTQSTTPNIRTHTKQLFCWSDGAPGGSLSIARRCVKKTGFCLGLFAPIVTSIHPTYTTNSNSRF